MPTHEDFRTLAALMVTYERIYDSTAIEPSAIVLPPAAWPGATRIHNWPVVRVDDVTPSLLYPAAT